MPADPAAEKQSLSRRAVRLLRPSHQHSAFSATVLLMAAVALSRVIGYVREAYIAWAFGAGAQTDAYVAAFTIPDWLNYLVAGGTASITFISIFSRYSAAGRDDEAQKAFSTVITITSVVLIAGIAVAEVFTPQLVRLLFPRFTPEQSQLCIFLTRILLPAQLFFYVGGIVSAVLASRRMFLFPALAPLLYNVFIILGGVLLGSRYGITGLAIGAVAGSFAGPFLINAIGAGRSGMRYSLSFDFAHPGFREWVALSIPLMLGVSVVAADEWILRYFASGGQGDITRLNYAKRLFAVPIAVLGQAAGQASLPFFARLFGEGRTREFSRSVSGSVYRIAAVSALAAAWTMAAALPLVDLVYRRGLFTYGDSQETAVFLFWFALSLPAWAAQALYSRAFYAAGNTLTPMIAATVVTVASLPLYNWLFDAYGVVGLAWASDLAIIAHTLVIAVLLHRRGLVALPDLPWVELWKAVAVAVAAGGLAWMVGRTLSPRPSYTNDLLQVAVTFLTWGAAAALGLWLTRSDLLSQLRRS